MTKKHFVKFANLIVSFNNGTIAGDIKNPSEWLIDEFCYIFEAENAKFDEQRFRQYIDTKLNN